MPCKPICKLCDKIVISQALTFAAGILTINIPADRSYNDGCKYCIVVAQNRPATTTADAPVVVTIGAGTRAYPLLQCGCEPVKACTIHSRTRYAVCVSTSSAGGTFRLIGRPCYTPDNVPLSLGTPAV